MATDSKPGRIGRKAARAAAPARATSRARRGGVGSMLGMDAERSARLLLIGAVLVVVLAATAFIGIGYYVTEVRPRHRTVLEVDGMKVSFSAMERRMWYDFQQNPTLFQSNPGLLADFSLEAAKNELLMISRAGELGITVTDEEIRAGVATRSGVQATADARQFADAVRTTLRRIGLNESEFRRLVHGEILRERIIAKFQAELPAVVPQAQIEVISARTSEEATLARERILAGEDWAVVAREMSTESDRDATGGLHDYEPQETINDAYASFAFTAPPGEVSPVLDDPSGALYYVVRVRDRGDQALRDDQKPGAASRMFTDWLDEQERLAVIETNWEIADKSEAILSVLERAQAGGLSQPLQPEQPQQPINVAPPEDGAGDPGAPAVPDAPVIPDAPADTAPEDGGSNEPVPVAPGAGDVP